MHVEVTGQPVGVELFPLWLVGSRDWAQEKNLLRISLDKPFPPHDSSWTPFPTSPSQIHVLFYHDDDDDSGVTSVSPVSVAHRHPCTRLNPEACTAYQGLIPQENCLSLPQQLWLPEAVQFGGGGGLVTPFLIHAASWLVRSVQVLSR